jgi:hypothetical protein
MPYTRRPFNPEVRYAGQVATELNRANDNFDVLAQAFVSDNPETYVVKNADKLDGYDASLDSGAFLIPVANSKGYLPIGWITTKNALTIYVDNVNGSDTTGDGSSANPFATVSKALSTLPIRLTHNVVIVLKASPVSYGSIYVRGFISRWWEFNNSR